MKIRIGDFRTYGTKETEDGMMFTFSVTQDAPCSIRLYDRRTKELQEEIFLPQTCRMGRVYSVVLIGKGWERKCYRICQQEDEFVDPYASSLVGRECWGDQSRIKQTDGVYGFFSKLQDAVSLDRIRIAEKDRILYKLHMRGFTMQHGRKTSERGNDKGILALLPYLKDLGVTSLEFQPIYEFEEVCFEKQSHLTEDGSYENCLVCQDKCNYWGYGEAYYFAPKASYFGGRDPEERCRDMIRKIHEAGMEMIMEISFAEGTSEELMLDCLCHWVRNYGVDGFHILGCNAPMEQILSCAPLADTLIFAESIPEGTEVWKSIGKRAFLYKDDFMYVGRQLQNHMEGSMVQFTNYLRRQNKSFGFVNYMADATGFTLYDSYCYGEKHNQENGEDNRDGNNFNCSFNYGVEGPAKNKHIQKTRLTQVRNGLCMAFLSQAVPMIHSGDECLNTQNGNNNPYCQDNEIGWTQFKFRNAEVKAMHSFLRELIRFRKEHTVFHQEDTMQFTDYKHVGMPDLSYHGAEPWLMYVGEEQKAIGILYTGAYAEEETDVFVAYNFHYETARIALPKLSEECCWKQVMNTADTATHGFVPVELEHQRYAEVLPQSISLLISCKEIEKEEHESNCTL